MAHLTFKRGREIARQSVTLSRADLLIELYEAQGFVLVSERTS